MDKLLQSILQYLKSGTRIELYSSHNRHLLDDENVILWDTTAASISPEIYQKFKDALHTRACKWYTLNKILPFHDFCIALLCSVGYSLNHNTMSQVQPRTFKSAWRTISVMPATADKDLQDWIRDRIQDRDARKYETAMGIEAPESPVANRRISFGRELTNFNINEDIISKACSSKNIQEITVDNNKSLSAVIKKSTATPECQLDNLRIIHSELIRK